MNPATLGHNFEERVKNALIRNNYVLIKKNKWIRNYAFERDSAKKREYDLVMFNTSDKQFYVIECKAHMSRSKTVPLEQVVKFNHVARNYGAGRAKKMIATDTDLSPRAKSYARKNNIAIMNGKMLKQIERAPDTPYLPLVTNIVSRLLKNYLSLLK